LIEETFPKSPALWDQQFHDGGDARGVFNKYVHKALAIQNFELRKSGATKLFSDLNENLAFSWLNRISV